VSFGADPYLGQELAQPPIEAVPNCRVHLLDATHWVHWDQADAVTQYLLDFAKE
jgi:pimeloyl-ACP methyl ester carboxylesterase